MAKIRRSKQAHRGGSAQNSRKHPTTEVQSALPVTKHRQLTLWCVAGLVLTAHFTWLANAAPDPQLSASALAREVQAGIEPVVAVQMHDPGQIGAATLHEYDSKGRMVRTGQDIDRNGKLEADGIDRIFRVEYSFERGETENVFWDVQRQWTCPRLNDPREILASEFRKRTGLAWGRHEQFGRMIGQTVQTIVPNLNHPEKSTRTTTTEYKSEDFYFTTVIEKGAWQRVEVRLSSLLRSVTERDLSQPDSDASHHALRI